MAQPTSATARDSPPLAGETGRPVSAVIRTHRRGARHRRVPASPASLVSRSLAARDRFAALSARCSAIPLVRQTHPAYSVRHRSSTHFGRVHGCDARFETTLPVPAGVLLRQDESLSQMTQVQPSCPWRFRMAGTFSENLETNLSPGTTCTWGENSRDSEIGAFKVLQTWTILLVEDRAGIKVRRTGGPSTSNLMHATKQMTLSGCEAVAPAAGRHSVATVANTLIWAAGSSFRSVSTLRTAWKEPG